MKSDNIVISKSKSTEIDNKKTKSLFNFKLAPIISSIIWMYVIVKLFVFDFDIYMLGDNNLFLLNLIKYKFFIIIMTVATLWIFLKKYFYLWLVYVLFFPFILVFWIIPVFVLKKQSWTLLFTVINFLITFFKNLKFNFIANSIALVCALLVLVSDNFIILYAASGILIAYLILTIIRSLYISFSPSYIFKFQNSLLQKLDLIALSKKAFGLNQKYKSKAITKLPKKQIVDLSTNLQSVIIINRGCLYIACKLEEYRESRVSLLFNLIAYVWLFLKLIFIFAFVNIAVYKINNLSFNFNSLTPNFLTFIYYSFSAIIPGGADNIIPILGYSIIIKMLMNFLGLFFLPVIVFNIIILMNDERFKKGVSETADLIRQQGQQLEKYIKEEYKLTLLQAIGLLAQFQTNLINWIFSMSLVIPENYEEIEKIKLKFTTSKKTD